MVPSNGVLDIVIIVFFFPALLVAIYAGLKHGFQKSAGWFNLILLCLFRLTGSALGLGAIYQPGNMQILAAGLVLSNMGTISLLASLLGLVGRVNESLNEKALHPKFAKLVQILSLVAMILAIVGGKDAFNSDAATRSYGHSLSQGAVILMIIIFVVAAGTCIYAFTVRHRVPHTESRLLHVCVAALPFAFVRLIYSICSSFLYTNSAFSMLSNSTTAIVLRAIMAVLMEFTVVALFLWAGCTVGRSAVREAERAEKYASQGVYQGEHGTVHENFNLATKTDVRHS